MHTTPLNLDALAALEHARAAAMNASDLPALEVCLADDALYIHSNGVAEHKTAYLESLRSGAVRYRDLQLEVLQLVRAASRLALAQGRMSGFVVRGPDAIPVRSLYLVAWSREPGGAWRLAAFQATREA